MREVIIGINMTILICYPMLSVGALVSGLIDSAKEVSICNSTKPRIVYVFPTYVLGCWLGEVP